MKTSDIVSSAIELVAKGWTQGASARDEKGWDCDSTSPKARKWCLFGAIAKAVCDLNVRGPVTLVHEIAHAFMCFMGEWEKREWQCNYAWTWNDEEGRTQEEVIYALCGFRDMLDSDPERNELGYWSARGLRPGARFDS